MTTTVRPRTPAELAVLVPYQLGYHPGPSVIITVLRDRRLGLLQRHDLIPDPEHCRHAARQALDIVDREGATALLVIGFEDDEGSSAPLREAVLAAADALDVPVQEHLVVRDGRWYAPDCHEACCPVEGLPLPRPEDVPAVAAFVHAGVAPVEGRESLVGGILPERDEERAARIDRHLQVLEAFERGRGVDRGERLVTAWRALLVAGPDATPVADLPDAVLARAALSLEDIPWRDALMTGLCPGAMPIARGATPEMDPAITAMDRCPWVPLDEQVPAGRPGDFSDEVLAVRARLVDLARLVPLELTPPVLVLVAHLAWWSGDGTVAAICLERALEIDPVHDLAGLMQELLCAGVRLWSAPTDTAAGEAA